MIPNIPIRFANREGIPCLEVQNVEVTDTSLMVYFSKHPYVLEDFQGLLLVRNTKTFTAPQTAVPIKFATIGVPGSEVAVTKMGDAEVTSATFPTGIYLFFYDRPTNKLQLISRDS